MIHGHSELFCLISAWHMWHPGVFPAPASNKHAKPFQSITLPSRYSFWLWQTFQRGGGFDSPEGGRREGEANSLHGGSGSTLLQRHFQRRKRTLKWTRFENSLGWCRQHGVQRCTRRAPQQWTWQQRKEAKMEDAITNTCVARARLHTRASIYYRLNQHHSGQFGPRMIHSNW